MDPNRISTAQTLQIHAPYYQKKHKSTIKAYFIDTVINFFLNLVSVYIYKVNFRLCMASMEGRNPIECCCILMCHFSGVFVVCSIEMSG